jgi:hypothetical protein
VKCEDGEVALTKDKKNGDENESKEQSAQLNHVSKAAPRRGETIRAGKGHAVDWGSANIDDAKTTKQSAHKKLQVGTNRGANTVGTAVVGCGAAGRRARVRRV